MNTDQVTGLLRAVLTAIGGFIAGKGWIPLPLMNEIVGALVTVGVGYWSYRNNSTPSMIATVKAMPEVSNVIPVPSASAEVKAAAAS